MSPELILSEHVRLGSSQVILSRDYNRIFDECDAESIVRVFESEIEELQRCVERMRRMESQLQADNTQKLKHVVDDVVAKQRNRMNTVTGEHRSHGVSEGVTAGRV